MPSKIGRPPSDSPKNIKLQIRVDKATLEELDACARQENATRSEIVRKGIRLVREEQDRKK